jgi:hypothetical protein
MIVIFFILFLQERKSVERDHLVRHASSTEKVANGFGHQQDDLGSGL